jgi:glycosyltransferase involved in cell wall biosynthesis
VRVAIFTGGDLRLLGGGEKWIIHVTRWLIKNGNDVTIFSFVDTKDVKTNKKELEKVSGARVEYYNTIRIPILDERIPIGLHYSVLRDFDVIYNMDLSLLTNYFLNNAARKFQKKYILGLHNPNAFRSKPVVESTFRRRLLPVHNKIKFWVFRNIKSIHVINTSQIKDLKKIKYEGKIYYIPNFVGGIGKAGPGSQKTFTVLFAGRLSILDKGIDLLCAIIKNVLKENENIVFRIAGGGRDGAKIIRDLAKKYPKNFKWLGFLSEKSLRKEYRRADLFILTSRMESFGLVIIEAQGRGVPVIAFRLRGGVRDIIRNPFQGKLITPFQIKEFSDAIIEYYNKWDLDRKSYNQNKVKTASFISTNYSERIIMPKILKMFNDDMDH